ncbi:unnamed protein product, partial [Rotaria sp. Silwood2]
LFRIQKNLRERIAVNNQQAPTNISYSKLSQLVLILFKIINIYVVLRSLNIKTKIILDMKNPEGEEEELKRLMFDIKIDLDEISLNINHDQIN